MNREVNMQDAISGYREINLMITGSPGKGDDSSPHSAVLRIISEMVPLAELASSEKPGDTLFLTGADFWTAAGMPAEGGPLGEGQLPARWVPLKLTPGSAAVNIITNSVLTLDSDGQAMWDTGAEERAAQQTMVLHAIQHIVLKEGLLGLPEWRSFLLFFQDPGEPIGVLIPMAPQSVSLAVADPFQVMPEYQPVLSEADVSELQGDHELRWVSILNIENDPFQVFVNLLGPIVYHPGSGQGKQVVLSNSGYPASYPLIGAAGLEQGR
jgi:flagellar assembly factor FliW